MEYFSILNLKQEPFSNSPDPEYFFHSREHQECLQKLELSLLLRRGLNVIIGDVGTGKTTLCRQLIRRFAQREEITTHLILDPHFANSMELLTTFGKMLMGPQVQLGTNDWQIKEQIKQYLFNSGVKQGKTTVLIIDEGQKIPPFCLEILREFLNYETNEYKLLQIIIFAQKEFENTIKKFANFADRINLYHYLKPLNFRDTRLMIKFRLEKSKDTHKKIDIFSYPAVVKIYRATGGYPRRIINLCHHCILSMIVQNRNRVSAALVRSCIKRAFPGEPRRWKGAAATAAAAVFAALIFLAFQMPDQLRALLPEKVTANLSAAPQNEIQAAAGDTDTADEAIAQQDNPTAPGSDIQPEVTLEAESEAEGANLEVTAAEQALVDENRQVAALDPDAAASDTLAPIESSEAPSQTKTGNADRPLAEQAGTLENDRPYAPILGNIILERDDTLSLVIQTVYGSFNSRYFRSLILANPIIDDPDLVDVGQRIYVPAIPVPVKHINRRAWWVLLDEKDDLNAAFDYLRHYPATAPPARLIPYWNRQAGTRFAVVLKRHFSDLNAAMAQLRQMPPGLAPEGRVLSSWNRDTVFFANPFIRSVPEAPIRAQEE